MMANADGYIVHKRNVIGLSLVSKLSLTVLLLLV